MKRKLLWLLLLLAFSTGSFAADQTYNFVLPAKVKITIVEAPYEKRPASACPGSNSEPKAVDYRPKTYVKSISALFQGQTIRFDVTCMTDAWNGRPLQHEGAVRYFGGWCDLYDKKLQVDLLSEIRPLQSFDSIERLVQQIREDVETTRCLLNQRLISS